LEIKYSIKKLIILFYLFSTILYAYDSIEIEDKNIKVLKNGFYKTKNRYKPKEILKIFNENKFSSLPKEAKSFGLDNKTYWFGFEVVNNAKEEIYLEVKDITADYVNLYIFEDNKLIQKYQSGYNTPLEDRAIKTLPIRFKLQNKTSRTYILQIDSANPQYSAFSFGNKEFLQKDLNIRYFILIFAFGIFIAITLYNIFLFSMTKDRSYAFYLIHISASFIINFMLYGYLHLIDSTLVSYFNEILFFAALIQTIALTLFTESFLNLKQSDIKLFKINRILLYITVFSFLTIFMAAQIQIIGLLFESILYLALFYSALKSYIKGFKLAIYYIIATGVSLILSRFFILYGFNMIDFSIWTLHFSLFTLIWDMLFLSLALAFKLKALEEKNLEKERLLILTERSNLLGNITQNIAHQWRTPLAEVSAILTNINTKSKYTSIAKDEIILSTDKSNTILKHLSKTVDTFQNYFQVNSKFEIINIKKTIDEVIILLDNSLKNISIKIESDSKSSFEIMSIKNELIQVIMNILINTKEILKERDIKEGKINISILESKDAIYISIKDNAGGIKVKDLNSIFKPYFSQKTKGTGLGLFLCKTILNSKLNGDICAKNHKDGAIFEISLFKNKK